MARFLRRVGSVAVCLGALNACEFKFGADWYDDYSKPGVSSEGRTAAINQCRQRIGQTGGAVANKSAYVRSDRMDNCLQRRGFAKRGRRGPAGR